MITSAFTYIAILIFLAGALKLIESKSQLKIFQVLPAIVVLYFTVMVLSSLGIWQQDRKSVV